MWPSVVSNNNRLSVLVLASGTVLLVTVLILHGWRNGVQDHADSHLGERSQSLRVEPGDRPGTESNFVEPARELSKIPHPESNIAPEESKHSNRLIRRAGTPEGREVVDEIQEADVPKYRDELLEIVKDTTTDLNVRIAAIAKLTEFYRGQKENDWLAETLTQAYRIEPVGLVRSSLISGIGDLCRKDSPMRDSRLELFRQAMYFDLDHYARRAAVSQFSLREDPQRAIATLSDLAQREMNREVRRSIGDKLSELKRALERRNE